MVKVKELDAQDEIAALKAKLAGLSADQMRASREIGERDKKLKQMAALEAENQTLRETVTVWQNKHADAVRRAEAVEKAADADRTRLDAAAKIAEGVKALL